MSEVQSNADPKISEILYSIDGSKLHDALNLKPINYAYNLTLAISFDGTGNFLHQQLETAVVEMVAITGEVVTIREKQGVRVYDSDTGDLFQSWQ